MAVHGGAKSVANNLRTTMIAIIRISPGGAWGPSPFPGLSMLRGSWTIAVILIATVACGVPALVANVLRPGTNATMVLGRVWSRVILRATGARVRYVGLENVLAHQPCIYISNHLSNVDIWALIAVLPVATRFVAKQSLFRIPLFGTIMRTAGFVSIDRQNRGRAIGSLRVAAEKIRSGRPVLLFAEGTRSRSGRLAPFKKGPFYLAIEAAVPIVPIVITGSGRVMPPGSMRVTPGPVAVSFLPPVDVAPFLPDDLAGLMRTVRAPMEDAVGGSPRKPEPVEAGVP